MLKSLKHQVSGEASAEKWPVGSPYPGLRPFGERDTEIFFGREREIAELLGLLELRQLVVVHGASGCGKSSVVRAGLLPLFRLDALANEKTAKVAIVRPADEGGPLFSLARQLYAQFGEIAPVSDGNEPDAAWVTLLTTSNNWVRDLGYFADRSANTLCIVFDQFEEIFAADMAGYSAQVRRVIEFLNGLGEASPEGTALGGRSLSVIVTMRSDYLGNCASWEGLAETVNRSQYLLPRITSLGVLHAIHEPARAYAATVTDEVADALLRVVESELDGLPIVQHALMRAWRTASREGAYPCVDFAALAAVGGARGALSRHADEVLNQATIGEPASSDRAEWMLRALCDLDSDGRIIRRSVTLATLSDESGIDQDDLCRLLAPFRRVENSLIVPGDEDELHAGTILTVSHEALLRQWKRISDISLDDHGQVIGYAYRELQDGLVWRALAVQAAQFARDGSSILGPASTEQRLPWYRKIESRPGWVARHHAGRPINSTDASTQWAQVSELMNASETNLTSEREKLAQERKLVVKLQSWQSKARRFQTIAAALALSVIVLLVIMFLVQLAQQKAAFQERQERERAAFQERRQRDVERIIATANSMAQITCGAGQDRYADVQACIDRQAQINLTQSLAELSNGDLATSEADNSVVPSSPYRQIGGLGRQETKGSNHNVP